MARVGDVYQVPAGTYGSPNTTISSTAYNANVNDVAADLNYPRPIVAGGTAATNDTMARANLKTERSMQAITDYNTATWETGSFSSDVGATNSPDGAGAATNKFAGTVQVIDTNNIVVEARNLTTGTLYVRKKVAGGWGAWSSLGFDADYVNVTGDTMTGNLSIYSANPQLNLDTNDPAGAVYLYGKRLSSLRWMINFPDSMTESGGSTGAGGSDFRISRFRNDGVVIDVPLLITRATGNVTLTGIISAGNGRLWGASDGTPIWTTGGTISGNLTVVGTIRDTGGRIVSEVAGSPSVAVYTTSGAAFGFWVNGSMYFGTTNAQGDPTGAQMSLASGGLTLLTGNAYKSGGGPWVDTSDARIKTVNGDYTRGLSDVITLHPVRYTYKGNETYVRPSSKGSGVALPDEKEDTAPSVPYANSPHYDIATKGTECIGLIAQECEAAFPEMVTEHAGQIDGKSVSDIRNLDTGPLLFALVNAVKEMAARIEALEAAAGG